MQAISNVLALVLRSLLRLALLAGLGVFMLSLLVMGLAMALLSVLWALLRGKKPALFTIYQAFAQATQRARGPWAARAGRVAPGADADVVDVEVVERVEVRPLLPSHERSPARD